MFEVNGIVFGDDLSEPIYVEKVQALENMMLLLDFNNGERKLFDATILRGSVFEKLKDESVFQSPVIDHGVVTWDGGAIDCAPEYMYAHSYTYNQQDILSA